MERKLIEDLTPTLEGKIRDVIADNIVAVKHTEQTVEGLEKKIAGCEKTLEHEEKRTVDLERRIAECKSFIEEVRGLEVIVFVGDELVDEQVI